MNISTKNKPVVDRLILLLAKSEDVANAILDNSIDDGTTMDPVIVAALKHRLLQIAYTLDASTL